MCHAPAKLLLFWILQCILTALFDLLLAVTVIKISPLTIKRTESRGKNAKFRNGYCDILGYGFSIFPPFSGHFAGVALAHTKSETAE